MAKGKGKQRDSDKVTGLSGMAGKRANKSSARLGLARRHDDEDEDEDGSEDEGPVASTSRRQLEDGDDSDEDVSEMEADVAHEEEGDQQPGFAQYMGESDMDDESEEDQYGEDMDSSDASDDAPNDNTRGEDDEDKGSAEMQAMMEEMKKIPLATLLKAQKRLAKASKKEKARKAAANGDADGDEDAGEGKSSKQRRGREAPRREIDAAVLEDTRKKQALDERKTKRVKVQRDNKHAPSEVSSKRAVGRFRHVVEVPHDTRRDPRFDNLSGTFEQRQFDASYSFLDTARRDEIKRIRTALRATKKKGGSVDATEREAMVRELERLQSKQASVDKERREKDGMEAWKSAEREKRGGGKRAFFLKDAERKKILEDQRMEQLSKDKRKLRKVMDRKKRSEKLKDIKSAPPLRQT